MITEPPTVPNLSTVYYVTLPDTWGDELYIEEFGFSGWCRTVNTHTFYIIVIHEITCHGIPFFPFLKPVFFLLFFKSKLHELWLTIVNEMHALTCAVVYVPTEAVLRLLTWNMRVIGPIGIWYSDDHVCTTGKGRRNEALCMIVYCGACWVP